MGKNANRMRRLGKPY